VVELLFFNNIFYFQNPDPDWVVRIKGNQTGPLNFLKEFMFEDLSRGQKAPPRALMFSLGVSEAIPGTGISSFFIKISFDCEFFQFLK
jgi:hypothetical protein